MWLAQSFGRLSTEVHKFRKRKKFIGGLKRENLSLLCFDRSALRQIDTPQKQKCLFSEQRAFHLRLSRCASLWYQVVSRVNLAVIIFTFGLFLLLLIRWNCELCSELPSPVSVICRRPDNYLEEKRKRESYSKASLSVHHKSCLALSWHHRHSSCYRYHDLRRGGQKQLVFLLKMNP